MYLHVQQTIVDLWLCHDIAVTPLQECNTVKKIDLV